MDFLSGGRLRDHEALRELLDRERDLLAAGLR
jgi:hypothetical protein